MFAIWGRLVYRFRWLVLVLSVLSLAAAGAVMLLGWGGRLGSGQFRSEVESARAQDLIDEQLAARPPSFTLVFSSPSVPVSDPRFRAELERALKPLRGADGVVGIRTAWDTGTVNPQLVSKDGKRTYAVVEMADAEWGDLMDRYERLRPKVTSTSLEVLATGTYPLNHDFTAATEKDLRRAEFVSLPLVLIMLLIVFGSVAAAGLPLGVGLLAVGTGFVGTLLLANVTEVSIYATNVVTMIGLGVAIDYSLFIVSRFREEVHRRPIPDALAVTMSTAGRAIAFSALTVAIGLGGLLFFRLGDMGSIGLAGTVVVALALVYALTFLPALLAILGTRVNALRVPFVHPERTRTGHGAWHRIATAVMARPWAVLVPTVALLLLLGAPVLHLRLGSADATALPRETESRRGLTLLEDQFPGGETNPVIVVLNYRSGSPLTPERVGQLYDASRWLAKLPNVSEVQSAVDLDPKLSKLEYQQLYSRPVSQLDPRLQAGIRQSVGGHIATLVAYTPFGPGTDQAREVVRTVRAHGFGTDGEVLVTGQTARDLDTIQLVKEDAPKAVVFIVLATYVVLFLLLGSVLLPLKAVLMNFLSISASYGALVWIFQEGHLSGWLNFTPNAIETSTPLLMFCVLFGLSMDYEVLLLSRVKEEYDRSGDNTQAVAISLERTGRLITSAAIIMASVFFSFGLANT
ncbi:MAG: MMPL family transporter, partial [Chloroflexota bacterium]|nr:MMPL family transporter [Chloroflexota bacterium]